jgi:hypothetical protein
MLAPSSHPIHLAVLAGAIFVDVAGLPGFNRAKAASSPGRGASYPWHAKRTAYWAYIAFSMAISCWMDATFDISEFTGVARNYALAFPLGLLDFYFSDVSHVSFSPTCLCTTCLPPSPIPAFL